MPLSKSHVALYPHGGCCSKVCVQNGFFVIGGTGRSDLNQDGHDGSDLTHGIEGTIVLLGHGHSVEKSSWTDR